MTLQNELDRAARRLGTRALLNDPRIISIRAVEHRSPFAPYWFILQLSPGYRTAKNPGVHTRVDASLRRLARYVQYIAPCGCARCLHDLPVWQVQTEFGLTADSSADELAIAADRLEDIGGAPTAVGRWRRGDPFGVFDLSGDIRRLPEWAPMFV